MNEQNAQPDTTQPAPTAAGILPNVQVQGIVVVGPGGQPLVGLQLHYGPSQHVLVMTPETAVQLGPIITDVCNQVAAQARRAAAGLVVAGPDDLKGLILPPNGR